jgi:polysaccharide biosynthesis transport protein
MDLKAYITPLLKYWWLLLFSALIAATTTFIVMQMQPKIYQSRTSLIIGRAIYQPNPSGNDFYLSQQLASFYADLAIREQVRTGTMAALGMDWLPQYSASFSPNSQLLEIIVMDTVPERAQAVANELAKQLIKQTPVDANAQDQGNEEFISKQLTQLRQKITETENAIQQKQKDLQDLTSARQIADAQLEIATLESKLSTLQNNYALLLSNSDKGANNSLTVFEPADLPTQPVSSKKVIMVLLAITIALTISGGAAYLLEFLDDTLKSSEEITKLLHLPVLGYISQIKADENEPSYISKQPLSPFSDSFRSLRTKLDFVSVNNPMKVLLVTSAGVGEGKTFVSINLATIYAQGGKSVVLIDGDLRKPNIHRSLGLPNEKGLSDFFLGTIKLNEIIQDWGNEGIKVVTSGSLPPNPAELFGMQKMNYLLEQMGRIADIIIIDSPPLMINDSVILATKADAVLLVIRHGFMRKRSIVEALNQIKEVGGNIAGVVLNRIPRSSGDYYYRNYKYYSDNSAKETNGANNTSGISKNGKSRNPLKIWQK